MKTLLNIHKTLLFAAILVVSALSNAQTVSYLWSNGAKTPNIFVNPQETTTYYVTITQDGVEYLDSLVVTVTPPPVVAINGNNTVCMGFSTTLQATAGSTYLWSTGESTASITVNPSTNTTYFVQVTDASGCTGTAEINVMVNQPSATTETVTACGSYIWNGNTYNQSGTYTWTGTNAAGCDSLVTLNLTITPQPEQPQIACWQTATFNAASCSWVISGTQPAEPTNLACYESAVFNSNICEWEITGTQPANWYLGGGTVPPPPLPCNASFFFNDVTCEWEVTGTPAPAIVTNASACESYTWEANGQSYTSSGNFTFSENCQDYRLNLTINQATASTVNATITQGESYSFNGQSLTTAGTYTATLQNAAGCDSVVTLNLTVNAAPQICDVTVSDTEICAGESVSISVGGVTPSPGGCSSANMPANLQQGLVAWYPFCGNAEDESPNNYNGTVRNAVLTTDRFGNANQAYSFTTGQDIIVNGTQGLNLYPMSISLWYNVDTIVSIYDEANIFSKYSPAAWNGYAIITSNMAPEEGNVYYPTVKPWYTRSINNRIIGRYGSAPFEHENIDLDAWHHMVFTVAPDGGKCYVNGQLIATDTWDGAAGPSSSSFIWKIGGLYDYWYNGKIDDIAVYNRVLTAAEATQLYQYQAQSETTSILWSNGEATPTINVSPSETTTYTVTVNQGTQTCTSDVTIMVNQPSATSETASACNSYTWNGSTYTQSGTYTWTGNNVAGCDSVVTLNLTITPQPAQPSTACYQTATFNNQTCSWVLSGTQPAQPPTACYQTATFNDQTCSWDVTGTQPAQPATACYQTATFNNQSCAWVLTGTQPTQPATACYETASFNALSCSWVVTGSPAPAIVTNASACGSYTWEANGQTYTTSGNYSFSTNCQDYTLNLTINQASTSTVNATITQGESYSFNGQNLTTAGTYFDTLQNVAGCDLYVTLNLTVNPAPVAGCYATSVVNFTQGQRADATNVIAIRSNATQALGMPEPVVNNVVNFVSLGFGGSITLAFEIPIANGAGNDIRIDEATWGNNTCNNYPEKADVFASQDGTNFIYLGRACHDASFDLGVMSWAKYIRVVDVSNTLSFTSDADGFDVNGIECLNGASINPTDDGLQACTLQEIVSYTPANRKNGTAVPAPRNNANNALGAPQSNNTINFVSLGFGGTLVAKFDFVVFNQAGNDLRVTETSFGNPSCSSYPERARVSVSLDGNSWSELGEICLDGSLDFGTVPYAQYIRITDSSPLSSSRFNGSADGFDVDAVVVLNNGCGSSSARFAELDNTTTPDASMTISAFPNPMEDYTIVNFDGLEIETDFNFQIMDAAGRLIRNENILVSPENPTYLFTATELARGIYQIVISNKNDNQVIRLVK